MATFNLDPEELHPFPDRLFRRLLQHPANVRETIEDLDADLAAKLDFDRLKLWQREHIFEDWRKMERDLPLLIPYIDDPDENLLICILLEHQSQPDRLMPLRMLLYGCFFWESEWKSWQADRSTAESLGLTAVLPVVFHTGLSAWNSCRTLGELIRGPDELKQTAPIWPIRFWNVTDKSAEQFLEAKAPWLNAMAVIRATNDDASIFQRVFTEAVDRLDGMIESERMRWIDLMWMIISWAIRRRPKDERQALVEKALERQTDPRIQEEIQIMSTTLGQTLEQWAEERGMAKGIEKGIEKGSLETCRELLCELLEQRFGVLPDEIRKRIEAQSNREKLHAAVRSVLSLDTLEQLEV